MSTVSALIVAAGAPAPPEHNQARLVIAADSGLDAAVGYGLEVDIVVGDLDSADPALVAAHEQRGGVVERHQVDKDESDLELALAAAIERGCADVHVLLDDGGRLDHALANLAVLASPRWATATVSATVGPNRLWVVRRSVCLELAIGTAIALQPIGGAAVGVTTTGVAYPLAGETLDPYSARGIANRVTAAPATIEVGSGVVLVIATAG